METPPAPAIPRQKPTILLNGHGSIASAARHVGQLIKIPGDPGDIVIVSITDVATPARHGQVKLFNDLFESAKTNPQLQMWINEPIKYKLQLEAYLNSSNPTFPIKLHIATSGMLTTNFTLYPFSFLETFMTQSGINMLQDNSPISQSIFTKSNICDMFNESLKPTRSDVELFLNQELTKPKYTDNGSVTYEPDTVIPLAKMMILQDAINDKFKMIFDRLLPTYLSVIGKMNIYNLTCRVLEPESRFRQVKTETQQIPLLRANSDVNSLNLVKLGQPITSEQKAIIDAKHYEWLNKNRDTMVGIASTFVNDSGLTEQQIIAEMEIVGYNYTRFREFIDDVIDKKNTETHKKLNAERIKQDNKDWLDERLNVFKDRGYTFLSHAPELEDYVPPPGWRYYSGEGKTPGYYYIEVNDLDEEGEKRGAKKPAVSSERGGKRTKKSSKSKKKRNKTKKKKTNKRKKTKRSRK